MAALAMRLLVGVVLTVATLYLAATPCLECG